MRNQRSWVLRVLTIIALVIAVHEARAQMYPSASGPGYPATADPNAMPAYAPGAAMGPTMGYAPPAPQAMNPAAAASYGQQMVPQAAYPAGPAAYGYQPTGYYDPSQGAAPQPLAPVPSVPMGSPMMANYYGQPGAGEPVCSYCGGYGCEMCMGADDDFDTKLLNWLLPYGEGGCASQRWYDAEAQWVYLRRDDVATTPTVFATDGLGGTPVLGTDSLGFAENSGFQASAAIQLGAGNSLETSYLGMFNWATQAQANSNINNLYSIMSQFGTAPFNGFDDTDRASAARLEYSTALDTIELNYRQRWVAPNARIQGSYLAGIRYLYLSEDFRYLTFAPANPGSMDYLVSTSNSLTGAQAGGDLWVCIVPGVRIGAEGKAGVYGNRATQRTTIQATSIVTPVQEKLTDSQAAFMADANISLIWRINQNWTFRTGYMFLWLDSVALAPDNFNAAPPFVAGQRVTSLNNGGDVFYHGFTAGMEWMW